MLKHFNKGLSELLKTERHLLTYSAVKGVGVRSMRGGNEEETRDKGAARGCCLIHSIC